MKRKLALALVCAVAMSACTAHHDTSPGVSVDTGSIVNDKSLTPSQKAEKLALGAEQLFTPQSFMYADSVADMALTFDATNSRAQLIKAVLKPAILTKGIYKRIKGLYSITAQGRASYQQALDSINQYPNTALTTFLLDGKEDINTEVDAQKFIAAEVKAFDDMRLFFKTHKDLQLTVNIPEMWEQQRLDERSRDCVAHADYSQTPDGTYSWNCDFKGVMQVKVDRGEMESFQQIASGYEMYLIVYNAYNVDGLLNYIKSTDGKDLSTISNQQAFNSLMSNRRFGTIRDAAGLKQILTMGTDAITGARWALASQNSLCKTGDDSQVNRPGYVFSQGLCAPKGPADKEGDSAQDVLRTVEVALQGGVLSMTTVNLDDGSVVNTNIKPSAPFANPIKDIRDLGTFTWNSNTDSVSSIGDSTYGGLFPNGDGNKLSAIQNPDSTIHAKK